jgi:parallel beta-helix repeat protein
MRNKVPFEVVALTVLILGIGMTIGIRYGRVVNAAPDTIVVSLGPGAIQEAINAASPGDVIKVTDGTYYENVIVNKSVSIIGEDPSNTIIDGGGKPIAVDILSSNVVVSGFTIQNGTGEVYPYIGLGSGISIYRCNSATIKNNILRNNYYGLQLTNSSNCMIFNNIIMNSSTAGTAGIAAGIYIHDSSSNNVFFQNTIENNAIGLYTYCPSNTFYHNNFINNTRQCLGAPPVTLDNNAIKEGNYWSDYEGSDTNLTGIGDSPFVMGFFNDSYPLMGMFTNFTIDYEGQSYFLSTICNSTISNFEFNESSESIGFNVIGLNGTVGFCRIAIPVTLIQNKFTILVDGKVPVFGKNWNTLTYYYRCFVYANTGATRKVTVELGLTEAGTSPSFLVPALIAVPSVAIVLILITVIRGNLGKKVRSKFLKRQSLILSNCY